jgi:hypothetical protein
MGLKDRFQRAWNIFINNRDPTSTSWNRGYFNSYRPDRVRFSGGNERSIVTAVYNRIAMDAAAIDVKHVRVDENDRYKETISSGLNNCLTTEANLDQTGRAFLQDVFMSMLDEGCIAIVPVDADVDPANTDSYDILSLRTGKILEWEPKRVRVQLYDERTAQKRDVWVDKRKAAIVENPLYAVINERNSTMQRLIRKLNILDAIDEQSGSGKLDLIIQLPYITRTDVKKQQAEERIKRIEEQLTGKFGIAYTDATEKVVQLNRPVENNLMKQIEYLTSMLYSQLGITQSILDGSADDKTMLNYYTRTIEPMIAAVVDEMKRKFLTKTARTQGQSIVFFRDPFKLVPIEVIADIGYKFKTAGILSTNDIRQILGKKPSDDPEADKLTNSTTKQSGEGQEQLEEEPYPEIIEEGEIQNGAESLEE